MWCNLLAVLLECYEARTFRLPQGSAKLKAVPGNLYHSSHLQIATVNEVYIWWESHQERRCTGMCQLLFSSSHKIFTGVSLNTCHRQIAMKGIIFMSL